MDRDKGHNKEVAAQANDPSVFFGDVPRFVYVYKKTEKIVTALYMVTAFLPDAEPLKWKIRKIGGDMLSLTNQLKDTFSTQRDAVIHSIKSSSMEIASLLDVSRFAGLMSEMNSRVLKEEIGVLLNLLSEQNDDPFAKGLVLGESFFEDGAVRPEARRTAVPLKDMKRPMSGREQNKRQGATPRMSRVVPAEKKEDRRSAVLDVVRKKGVVTIKDVSDVVRDVSEKTIQRELLSLVAEGLLKKEGERRWSRYSLAV